MYIITEFGYKSKPKMYENKELLMFEQFSRTMWKVYTIDNKVLKAISIEKREVLLSPS
jgi:hypothetical protein